MSPQLATRRGDAGTELKPGDGIDLESLPTTMGTTGSKLVYLYLQVVEETTIEDLAETLDMKMLTLYPMLGSLEEDGLIERDGETFAAT